MRWKIQLSYLGTRYAGWQKQPGDVTVQQTLEEALGTTLRQPIQITGCGRTDAGVHARKYVAHMDAELVDDPSRIRYQVNAILPSDIALHHLEPADPDFHARFQATDRLYRYYLHFDKNPFLNGQSFFFHRHSDVDTAAMDQLAALLLRFDRFKPFCKTGSDTGHYLCQMMESYWSFHATGAVYTVRANRFLRGMVRLIVGVGLNAGLGKVNVEQVEECLITQSMLPQAWSVPPEGLFLEDVRYPIHPDTV